MSKQDLRCVQEFYVFSKGDGNGMTLSKDFELYLCPLNPRMYYVVNDLPYISTGGC